MISSSLVSSQVRWITRLLIFGWVISGLRAEPPAATPEPTSSGHAQAEPASAPETKETPPPAATHPAPAAEPEKPAEPHPVEPALEKPEATEATPSIHPAETVAEKASASHSPTEEKEKPEVAPFFVPAKEKAEAAHATEPAAVKETPKEHGSAHPTETAGEKVLPADKKKEAGVKPESPATPAHQTERVSAEAKEAVKKDAEKERKESTASAHESGPEHPASGREDKLDEATAQSYLRIADKYAARKDYDSGEIAYYMVLNNALSSTDKEKALVGLGRLYRRKGDFTKAMGVLEKFIKDYPTSDQIPLAYLDLGRTMRAMGSYKYALTEFYGVINSTLKISEDKTQDYQQLAKTAQFEIAETYFMSGDYAEAGKFFSRLRLIDLAPQDRARAFYKMGYSQFLAGNIPDMITTLQSYLQEYPEDENAPEARYLLSDGYRQQKRIKEAYKVTLDLLRDVKSKGDPQMTAYWQRRTGNQIANEFYEQGDFPTAMTIYENLAALTSDPTWKLPVLYQIGLCHERLLQTDRADAIYQTILDELKQVSDKGPLPAHLSDLAKMATWRKSQLHWQKEVTTLYEPFLKNPHSGTSVGASTPHDAHGSPAAAPTAVR